MVTESQTPKVPGVAITSLIATGLTAILSYFLVSYFTNDFSSIWSTQVLAEELTKLQQSSPNAFIKKIFWVKWILIGAVAALTFAVVFLIRYLLLHRHAANEVKVSQDSNDRLVRECQETRKQLTSPQGIRKL